MQINQPVCRFNSRLYKRESYLRCAMLGGSPEGGTWVFFGRVCAARDSKLAPRSRNGPIFYTPF